MLKATPTLRRALFNLHVPPTPRARATSLLQQIQYTHPPNCPCHRNPTTSTSTTSSPTTHQRNYATPLPTPTPTPPGGGGGGAREYAFEMASSTIRFGPNVTAEVGSDFANLGFGHPSSPSSPSSSSSSPSPKKVLILTDPLVERLPVMATVLASLDRAGVQYVVYNRVRIEPKDYSMQEAIDFGMRVGADGYLAVGGGSVMDTAKVVNLLGVYAGEGRGLMDFVNAPLGKGMPIDRPLKPLICIPTTAGTGSETTGTAIFDIASQSTKTGISHRNLKPTLGLIDPLTTHSLPGPITASTGLDVLFHSLESLTAIPYHTRLLPPLPPGAATINPLTRPAYQGANPISDVFSLAALRLCTANLPLATHDPHNAAARSALSLAATLAGVGFGNAGVHLCHGLSYPISGLNPGKYTHPSYPAATPLIPHGVSVAVTAPAVFRFTAPSNPGVHLQAAEAFGVDVSQVKAESAGEVLSEAIMRFLEKLGGQPRGLVGLGIGRGDIGRLVDGTVPQRRVVQLAPGLAGVGKAVLEGGEEERLRGELEGLLEGAMEW